MSKNTQPSKIKRGEGFKHNFAQSNYITAGWNWFMTLAGKAAEPVLTISILYSCARLLPAVHIPVQVDNVVFIAQMVALDTAGLSLGKMAKIAKRAGNAEGATLAGRVSIALISIMVANVVLSVLQTIIPGMPAQLIAVIEAILLIARAIMAVCYAHVIHSLKGDVQAEQSTQPPALDDWAMVGLSAYLLQTTQQMIAGAIADVSASIDGRLSDLSSGQKQSLDLFRLEQQRLLGKVQDMEASVPEIDYEAIARAMMPQLRTTFQSQARAITEEVQGHVKAIIEEGQGQSLRPLSESGPPRQIAARASSQNQSQGHNGQPNLTLLNGSKSISEDIARPNGTPDERLQAAYGLLLKGSIRISGRSLAKEAHVSRDTASKWLAEVKGQLEEPEEATIIDTDAEIEAIAQGQ